MSDNQEQKKNPASAVEGQKQEEVVSRFGQSEVLITKDAVILSVHHRKVVNQ